MHHLSAIIIIIINILIYVLGDDRKKYFNIEKMTFFPLNFTAIGLGSLLSLTVVNWFMQTVHFIVTLKIK